LLHFMCFSFRNPTSPMHISTLYTSLHYTHLYIIHISTLYTSLHYTHLYIVHISTLYTSLHYIHLYIIHISTLYTSLHYTHLYIIHISTLYTSLHYTIEYINWKTTVQHYIISFHIRTTQNRNNNLITQINQLYISLQIIQTKNTYTNI